MNQNFEQDFPMPAAIAAFIVFLIVSRLFRNWQRSRTLIKEGQLLDAVGQIPTVEQRVAGNPAWANGEIFSAGRNSVIALCIAVLAWNLIIGIGFIKYLSKPDFQIAPAIVVGIFAILGIVLVVFAVRAILRYLHFGVSRCLIQGKAGVLGKEMTGRICTNNEIQATADYIIELQCIETYYTRHRKKRRTEIKVHWQSKQQIPQAGKSARAGIPFSIEIPKFPPETGYQLARGKIHWQLSIKAPVKGVDYAASFIVPVFKMDYSD